MCTHTCVSRGTWGESWSVSYSYCHLCPADLLVICVHIIDLLAAIRCLHYVVWLEACAAVVPPAVLTRVLTHFVISAHSPSCTVGFCMKEEVVSRLVSDDIFTHGPYILASVSQILFFVSNILNCLFHWKSQFSSHYYFTVSQVTI